MSNRETIHAVYDDQLKEFLIGIGLYGDFKNGKINCAFCSEVITWENLHSVFPDSGNIRVACANPECVQLLTLRLQDIGVS